MKQSVARLPACEYDQDSCGDCGHASPICRRLKLVSEAKESIIRTAYLFVLATKDKTADSEHNERRAALLESLGTLAEYRKQITSEGRIDKA